MWTNPILPSLTSFKNSNIKTKNKKKLCLHIYSIKIHFFPTVDSYELSPGHPGHPLQNDCCLPLWKQPRRRWGWDRDSSFKGLGGSRCHREHLSFCSRERGVYWGVCQRLEWRLSYGHRCPEALSLEPPRQLWHQHRWRGRHHPPPHSPGKTEPGYVSGWKVGFARLFQNEKLYILRFVVTVAQV